ncbi:MAG: Mov34/MPN/PAD-1 family protein [Halobacteriaceae archaeon]
MGLFRSRQVVAIAEELLSFLREAAADTHPNEYMGLLRARRADRLGLPDQPGDALIVSDVLVIPGTRSSPVEATMQTNLIPNDGSAVGSVHSHPNGVLEPSDADVASFTRGLVHIILGAPYGPDDWEAYDSEGEPRELPVVDADLGDPESFFEFTQADIDEELQ